MITDQHAKEWLEHLSKDELIQLLKEHTELKQGLCAQVLHVPTGTDNWVQRAIRRGIELYDNECRFRKLTYKMSEMLLDAKTRTRIEECINCSGTGQVTEEETCSICKGTGRRPL